MAVIITNGNSSLLKPNGFYRVEAYNWGMDGSSSSVSALTTPRVVAATFANAGNILGVVAQFCGNANGVSGDTALVVDRSVQTSFQEIKGACTMDITTDKVTYATHGLNNGDAVCFATTGTLPTGLTAGVIYYVVNKGTNDFQVEAFVGGGNINMTSANGTGHTLWVVSLIKTLVHTDIINSDCKNGYAAVPIVFDSPLAVTTDANKYRFVWYQTVGTTGTWSIGMSNATNGAVVYAAWCDTLVTFADNDTVIAKDILIIDTTATLKGTLGILAPANARALTTCRQTDISVANVANVQWLNHTAVVTMTIASPCVVTDTAHGLQVGTSVYFTNVGGALPTGIVASTAYFTRSSDCVTPADEYWLYDTEAHAIAGGADGRIDTSGAQSGVHTVDNSGINLTIDGLIVISMHSGFRAGTSANRIKYASNGTLTFLTTIGTANGITNIGGYSGVYTGRHSFFVYGERPTMRNTTTAYIITRGGVVSMNGGANIITFAAHGLENGTPVQFTTSASLPAGISTGTTYYVCNKTTDNYQIEATRGGGFIDFTGNGSGTITQKSVIETTDLTGWSNGQSIVCGGVLRKGASTTANDRRTISSISGYQIIPSSDYAYNCAAGHPVVNMDRYGFEIIGSTTTTTWTFYGCSNLVIDGVKLIDISGPNTHIASASNYWSRDDATNRSKYYITCCALTTLSGSTIRSLIKDIGAPPDGFEISYNHCANFGLCFGSGFSWHTIVSGLGKSGDLTLKNNIQISGTGVLHGPALANTSSNLKFIIADNYFDFGNTGCLQIMGLGGEVSRNVFFDCASLTGALTAYSVINLTGTGNIFDNNVVGLGLAAGTTVNNVFTNSHYGELVGNTNDVLISDGILFGWKEVTPHTPIIVDTAYMNGCITGSELKIVNYDEVVNDIRSWHTEGTFTSAPASNNIIGQTIDSSLTLENHFRTTSETVIGMKIGVEVNAKIDNAAYYSGAIHTLPTVEVTYDVSSVVTDVAIESTSTQALLVVFAPTTNNNDIIIALQQNTDAAYADSKVTWDSLSLFGRTYGKIFTETTKVITQTTGDVIYTFVTPVTNTYITEATVGTVAAYTGITINHGTQTITISSNHTLAEMYDYIQYDLTKDENMGYAEWFMTEDGVTYSSAYNITIDGAVLTATNKTLSLPTKTFTMANGGSTTAKVIDILGSTVPVVLSGVIVGSRVIVNKTDGTELYNDVAAGTTVSFNLTIASDTGVKIYIRKGSSSAYYQPFYITGTITVVSGLSVSVSQIPDTVCSVYTAGIASDFTIDAGAKTITHISGTTVYSVLDLYSWLVDYFDSSITGDLDVPMTAATSTIFTLTNGYAISDADHVYLKSGAITEASGDTLWSNIYTIGTLTGTTTIYLIQNSVEIANYWPTGHIDLLIKVKSGGTLIDSGYIKVFAREYGKLYDHYLVDLSAGGRNVVPLSTAIDTNNVTASATVDDYTDIAFGFAGYTLDLGDGSAAYHAQIDCAGRTVQQVYEYTKYVTRRSSTYSLLSDDGQEYTKADAGFSEIKTSPFGSFAGGTFFVSQGVCLINVASADALKYVLTDDAGLTHQVASPPVSIDVSNIIAGSRLQIYDLTHSVELYNDIIVGTSYSFVKSWAEDLDIRIRLIYIDGASTAYQWYESQGSFTVTGMSIRADQKANAVYITNNIDGSTVTECSISGTTVRIYVDDPDNTTTAQRIYNWYQYYLFTEVGIREQDGAYVIANDTTHYTFANTMKIVNSDTTNPLNLTGANIVPVSGAATNIFDLTNGASIALNFNRVEGFAYSSGSGLSTEEHNKLYAVPADVWAATEASITDGIGRKLKNGANASISSQ